MSADAQATPDTPQSLPGADPDRAGKRPGIDTSRIRTVRVAARPTKVEAGAFAKPPDSDRSFGAFIGSLPDILEARSFRAVVGAIVEAARTERAVVCMIGGHIVKTGVAPLLIDLVKRGVITCIAGNGSAAIHDYEIARWGGTSEDVERGLADGTFGMVEETGREMNDAIVAGAREDRGLGEALANALEARTDLAQPDDSLLIACRRAGVDFTVHTAIGTETIHQHPAADGAAIGKASLEDFHRLAAHLERLEGGVVLNLGSAVIMPEVFLKALTVCRNVSDGRPREFVAADFDMLRHYRPRVNVVERPTRTGGGKGYQITGHHEIMIPLLAWAVIDRLEASE